VGGTQSHLTRVRAGPLGLLAHLAVATVEDAALRNEIGAHRVQLALQITAEALEPARSVGGGRERDEGGECRKVKFHLEGVDGDRIRIVEIDVKDYESDMSLPEDRV